MVIEAYILAWNESETIHLTIKHYKQFCSRIIIYDNFSTDNTREIAEALGCEVRLFGIEGVLDDKEYLKVKNFCWKGSDADWVIVCDADEILMPPPYWSKEITIFETFGWSIFSNDVPRETWAEVTNGIPDSNYSKYVCFNPKAIKEINYVYGCHEAKPEGDIKTYSAIRLALFHYKHIGGAVRVANRHALYAQRMSAFNRKWKLGYQYDEAREKTIKYFNECLAKSRPFSPDGF